MEAKTPKKIKNLTPTTVSIAGLPPKKFISTAVRLAPHQEVDLSEVATEEQIKEAKWLYVAIENKVVEVTEYFGAKKSKKAAEPESVKEPAKEEKVEEPAPEVETPKAETPKVEEVKEEVKKEEVKEEVKEETPVVETPVVEEKPAGNKRRGRRSSKKDTEEKAA